MTSSLPDVGEIFNREIQASMAADHEKYMREMTKQIQLRGSLTAPIRTFHITYDDDYFDEAIGSNKDLPGRIKEKKCDPDIFQNENPVMCIWKEKHTLFNEKLTGWLPSLFDFLKVNEFCPILAAIKSLAQEDSKSFIEYVKENELVAWFVLFLFTKVTDEYKEYATLCLERLLTIKMATIYQTKTSTDHLLHCVLTLPLTLEDNVEIVRQACCVLSFLCGCRTVTLTFDDNVKNRLLELAKHKEYTLAWPALHAIRYIAIDDQCMLTRIFEQERSFLFKLLHKKRGNDGNRIIEEACWIVDLIMRRHVDTFLKDGIGYRFFLRIAKQSYSGNIHIKKAAVIAISNATTCATNYQIRKLVKIGCLKVLCRHLDYFHGKRILTCCLDGIEHILQAGHTLDGYINLYDRVMDECRGWYALREVECLTEEDGEGYEVEKRAFDLEDKYHIYGEQYSWGSDIPSMSECTSDEDEEEEDPNQNDSKKQRMDQT